MNINHQDRSRDPRLGQLLGQILRSGPSDGPSKVGRARRRPFCGWPTPASAWIALSDGLREATEPVDSYSGQVPDALIRAPSTVAGPEGAGPQARTSDVDTKERSENGRSATSLARPPFRAHSPVHNLPAS